MSKIIKHTFSIPQLSVIDGELVLDSEKEETYTFTLLHKGMGIYEEISGEPLLTTLASFTDKEGNVDTAKLMSSDFLLNLASASYVKIEGDRFHNNRATAEEFRKSRVASMVNDVIFAQKLLEMATECAVGKAKNTGHSGKA